MDTVNKVWKLDKLVISQIGLLAQRRLARGVKLNHTEATVQIRLSHNESWAPSDDSAKCRP